ncbi:MAG: hypothetical protein ACI4EU_06260 [Butyrivibrio sp.]
MKDELDVLLENALRPNIEPGKKKNEKILGGTGRGGRRKRTGGRKNGLIRAAVIVVAVICVGTVGVYASGGIDIIKKVFVTEHGIFTGNPDYVAAGESASTDENIQIETLGHEEGDESVNWLTKDAEIVNGCTNTYYAYKDYKTALLDSGMPDLFSVTYENTENVIYCVSEYDGTYTRTIDAMFTLDGGLFSINETIITGNIAEDMAYGIELANTSNKREYTAETGCGFTLVDENRDGKIRTHVLIPCDGYYCSIMFEGMTDKKIHKILDAVEVK